MCNRWYDEGGTSSYPWESLHFNDLIILSTSWVDVLFILMGRIKVIYDTIDYIEKQVFLTHENQCLKRRERSEPIVRQ